MENADEHFSLKWSNFRSSITEGFHDFLQEERMVDVTLAAEGKFLQAHKLVLSVCSPYFKNLFNVNPCKHPVVIFKDVGHNELSYMLEFMYRGEVGVKHEELPSFLKLAESLKIKGLDGDKLENEDYDPLSKTRSTITRIRKKKVLSDPGTDNTESESNSGRQRDDRFSRQRKRRFSSNPKSDNTKTSYSKKIKRDQEKKLCSKNNTQDSFDNDDENPLIKLISNKGINDENSKPGDSRDSNIDNGLDADDDDDDDDTGGQSDDFDIPPSLFTADNATESEQIPQEKRKSYSMLWQWFTRGPNKIVYCNLCDHKMKFHHTGQLSRHLKCFHVEEYSQFLKRFKRPSPIWNHFLRVFSSTPDDKDYAICKVCRATIKYHNTSPMVRHLRTFHDSSFQTYKSEFLEQRKRLGHCVRPSILSSWAK